MRRIIYEIRLDLEYPLWVINAASLHGKGNEKLTAFFELLQILNDSIKLSHFASSCTKSLRYATNTCLRSTPNFFATSIKELCRVLSIVVLILVCLYFRSEFTILIR